MAAAVSISQRLPRHPPALALAQPLVAQADHQLAGLRWDLVEVQGARPLEVHPLEVRPLEALLEALLEARLEARLASSFLAGAALPLLAEAGQTTAAQVDRLGWR